MSLFDVEPWSSDKTTDNLNKKLFGGVNPKLPKKRKTSLENVNEKKVKLSDLGNNDIGSPSVKKKGKLSEEEKKKKKIQNKRKKQKLLKQQKKEEIKQKKSRNRYKHLSQDTAEKEDDDESSSVQDKTTKKKSEKKKDVNGNEKSIKNKLKNGSPSEEARLLKKKEKRMKEKQRRKEKIRALKAKEVLEISLNNSNNETLQDDSNDKETPKEGKKKRKRKPRKNKFKDLNPDDKKISDESGPSSNLEENKKKQKQNSPSSSQKNKDKNSKSVKNINEENINKKTKKQHKLEKIKSLQKKDKSENKKQSNSSTPKMSKKSPSKQSKSPFSVDKLKEVLASQKEKINSDGSSDEDDDVDNENDDSGSEDSPLQQNETQSLRERMQEKLNSARFRYLNQQLYSITSQDAKRLFANDKNAFKVYHQGFTSQVTKWPINPVDNMIAYIKKRPQSLVVADFGCGDAKIARSVANKVHSFDLVAVNEHITACDISKVPLNNGSVDIVVFCLALMGTNLTEFLREAHRVLKLGATMLIAEVTSRFEKISTFAKKLEKLGFTVKNTDTSNKMFVWLEVKKTKAKPDASAPDIELLPCVYKKR